MSDQKKQTIKVIAGKNGIGKSTILNHFLSEIKKSPKNIVFFLNTEENKESHTKKDSSNHKLVDWEVNFQLLIRKWSHLILENEFESPKNPNWSLSFEEHIINTFSNKYEKYLILSNPDKQNIEKIISFYKTTQYQQLEEIFKDLKKYPFWINELKDCKLCIKSNDMKKEDYDNLVINNCKYSELKRKINNFWNK